MVKLSPSTVQVDSDDEELLCPLCLEELDLTDRNFRPCKCGYQVCLWCWHNINEKLNSLCPACRAPYCQDDSSRLDPELMAAAEAERRRKKEKDRADRALAKASAVAAAQQITAAVDNNNHLSDRSGLLNVRVMQRNLVYVTGLTPTVAKEDILRRKEHFGKFGRIIKVAVNRKSATHFSAYVTFKRASDAAECISNINGVSHDGRIMRATFGTTKYCSHFLRHTTCTNSNCLYLHDYANVVDCFTKEDLQHQVQMDEFDMDQTQIEELSSLRVTIGSVSQPAATEQVAEGFVSVPPAAVEARAPKAEGPPIEVTSFSHGPSVSVTETMSSCDTPEQEQYSIPQLVLPSFVSGADSGDAIERQVLPGLSALGFGKLSTGPFGWIPPRDSSRAPSPSTISPPDSPRSQCRAQQQNMLRSLLPNANISFTSSNSSHSGYNLFGDSSLAPAQSLSDFSSMNQRCDVFPGYASHSTSQDIGGSTFERPRPSPPLWDPAIVSFAVDEKTRPPPPGLPTREELAQFSQPYPGGHQPNIHRSQPQGHAHFHTHVFNPGQEMQSQAHLPEGRYAGVIRRPSVDPSFIDGPQQHVRL